MGPPRRTPSRKHRHSVDEGTLESGGLRSGIALVRASEGGHLRPHGSGLNHHSQVVSSSKDKENQALALEGSLSTAGTNNSNVPQAKDSELGSPTASGKPKAHGRKSEDRALTPQSLSILNSQESGSPTGSVQSPVTASSMATGNGIVERSPTNGIKLFIPPLDFSTLHEHVDGTGIYNHHSY